eukprot:TRINITY_DN27552_c0_g1_i3.p1 TRINITY_DN27552_c0_g1~~TRINITY_DN27552_c0_g1_i3.p1  ORF type:complete len:158 (+),score=5.43 TRINITY_DN27552_c0_g1_i3:23-475(+)
MSPVVHAYPCIVAVSLCRHQADSLALHRLSMDGCSRCKLNCLLPLGRSLLAETSAIRLQVAYRESGEGCRRSGVARHLLSAGAAAAGAGSFGLAKAFSNSSFSFCWKSSLLPSASQPASSQSSTHCLAFALAEGAFQSGSSKASKSSSSS